MTQPPGGRPPTRAARTVLPAQQPLRPAIALAIITLTSALLALFGVGAAPLLAMAAVNLFFSFSLEGIVGDTLTDELAVITTLLQVLQWGVTLTGLVILVLGIREVSRDRAELRPGPR